MQGNEPTLHHISFVISASIHVYIDTRHGTVTQGQLNGMETNSTYFTAQDLEPILRRSYRNLQVKK